MTGYLRLIIIAFFAICQISLCYRCNWIAHQNKREYCLNAKLSKSPESPDSERPTPLRVSNTINIPVRQQIAWARAYKRLQSNAYASQSPPKRFKKAKGPKQEEEKYVEIDYSNTKPPAVFIDGYNIIGYINSVEGRHIELSDARDCLVSDLAVLRSATGWFINVVFDAYKASGVSGGRSIDGDIRVTYTSASETADNYIERTFSELRQAGFVNMVVATDDRMLQLVAGSLGAGHLSASLLLEVR